MDDLVDRCAGRCDDFGETRKSSGTIGNRHGEAGETAVGDKTHLHHTTEHREIDVAAREHEHDVFALEVIDLAREHRRERSGAGTFDDAFFELDQAKDRERDRGFVDGDDGVDDAFQHVEGTHPRAGHREAVRERG